MRNRDVLLDRLPGRLVRPGFSYTALLRFADWMNQRRMNWIEPDFNRFALYLASRRQDEQWIADHFSAIRERYNHILTERQDIIIQVASHENDAEEATRRAGEINEKLALYAAVDVDPALAISESVKPKSEYRRGSPLPAITHFSRE